MKISMTKTLLEMTPDSADEAVQLQAVWRTLIDCVNRSGKLAPVGEFNPLKGTPARFAIEGARMANAPEFPTVAVDRDCRAYCHICNRLTELKKGEAVPPCCGKLMEILD